ncbi:MAG: hypothetical protein KBD78_06420 [Oligoflexales bacterium]|nr:hypothetical protein [Oligoflexales bacterium]
MLQSVFILIMLLLIAPACANDSQSNANEQQIITPKEKNAAPGEPGDKVELDELTSSPFARSSYLNPQQMSEQSQLNLAQTVQSSLTSAALSLEQDIKINGEDELVIKQGQIIEIQIKLNPKLTQFYGEMYVLFSRADGSGVTHYCLKEWCQGIKPSYQGGLFDLVKIVGHSKDLPRGDYIAHFILDRSADGKIDPSSYISQARLTIK